VQAEVVGDGVVVIILPVWSSPLPHRRREAPRRGVRVDLARGKLFFNISYGLFNRITTLRKFSQTPSPRWKVAYFIYF
jgi:hypothetical protein